MKHTTLLLLIRGHPISHVLLGYKKTGFGKGKYTGVGGKVENNETIEEATIREMAEETSVRVKKNHLRPGGKITFFFPAKPEWNLIIHIYLCNQWQGTPTESVEISPRWFPISKLPFDNMWDDASYWYLKVLKGETIDATFTFEPDNETVASYQFH